MTKTKDIQPWFGSFTPYDPNAPPLPVPVELPEPSEALTGELMPAEAPGALAPLVPFYPAGRTFDSYLYDQLHDLEGTVAAMSGGSSFTTNITTPSNNDLLIYDSGTSHWINVTSDSIIGGPYLPIVGGTITGSPGTLTINAPNGETGNILVAQVNGSRRFLVDADGDAIFELTDTSNSGPTATVQISHRTSSGTPTTGFGSALQFWGEDTGHTRVHYATIRTEASANTIGAVSADLVVLNQQSGSSLEVLRIRGNDGAFRLAPNASSGSLFRVSKGTDQRLDLDATGLVTVNTNTDTQSRTVLDITPTFATATDATRKGKAVFHIWDTAARSVMEFGVTVANAPQIGFLGAGPSIRQPNASAAGIALVSDANAKAALTAIYNLLLQFGLADATA